MSSGTDDRRETSSSSPEENKEMLDRLFQSGDSTTALLREQLFKSSDSTVVLSASAKYDDVFDSSDTHQKTSSTGEGYSSSVPGDSRSPEGVDFSFPTGFVRNTGYESPPPQRSHRGAHTHGNTKFHDMFTSGGDWSTQFASRHVDVDDVSAVFHSTVEETHDRRQGAPPSLYIEVAHPKIDWDAVYESKLPPSHHVNVGYNTVRRASNLRQEPPPPSKKIDWDALYESKLPPSTVPIAQQHHPTSPYSWEAASALASIMHPVLQQHSDGADAAVTSPIPPASFDQPDSQNAATMASGMSSQGSFASSSNPPQASAPTKKRRKRTRPNYEPEVKEYVEVTDNDVLLGRGGRTNHHPGNKKYLVEKDRIQPRYLAASKDDKTAISQELVDIVYAWGGRFLKLEEETNKWYRVPNIVARKKASQTLRELNTPEERAAKRARYQS